MRSTKRKKIALLLEWGGACQRCGYNKCQRALQFHHKDSSEKAKWSKDRGNVSIDEVRAHPERFELLCANCHFELHDEIDVANATYAICAYCGDSFTVEKARLADGHGKYCKKECEVAGRKIRSKPLEERFWKHVEKTADCWFWTAFKDSRGYGRINFEQTPILAHRVSWEIHNGPIPDGMSVLHHCDNPSCIRPDHLFLGNASDKMNECSKKGRTTRGERSKSSKLTEALVSEIRTKYASGTISQSKLAKEYGVCQATINEVVRGFLWKHSV